MKNKKMEQKQTEENEEIEREDLITWVMLAIAIIGATISTMLFLILLGVI